MTQVLLYFFISLLTALALGPVVLPRLIRLKFGQSIREEGPSAHFVKKGTPTMGGILFVVAFITPLLLTLSIEAKSVQLVVFGLLGYGFIGFYDDYLKVVKKHNLGLLAKQKLFLQVGVSMVLVILLGGASTALHIPFSDELLQLGWLYYPLMLLLLVGVNNSVNLTDGLDGLAASVTLVVAVGFALIAYLKQEPTLALVNVGMVGALLGYLKYNWYPAKVFMGDTGSLALGGYVAVMAALLNLALYLPLIGLIYMAETLSVIIQVLVYKKTQKRVFKMTPIHHHFELCNWKEQKIVLVFTGVTLAMVLISIWGFTFGGVYGF